MNQVKTCPFILFNGLNLSLIVILWTWIINPFALFYRIVLFYIDYYCFCPGTIYLVCWENGLAVPSKIA